MKVEIKGTLGQRMKKIMFLRGITQRELAEKMGVTTITVHRWVSGKKHPRLETIKEIERILEIGVLTEEFVNEKENDSNE